MYNTRSSKQLETVTTLRSEAKNIISSETNETKQKFVSSSGRVVLSVKNKSDHENLNKSGKNIQLSVDSKIKTVSVCKTQSPCLRKNKCKDINKNKNCVQTVVNKENITEIEHTAIKKDCEGRKCNTDKKAKKINTKILISKSNEIQNKSLENIYVDKKSGDTSRNKFFKSLHLNKNSIPQHKPVWKMCPNNNQESKKRGIDVYDITEDNDLKMEGFNKKKKILKQKISKVKKPFIKANNNVIKRHQDKVFNSETKALSEKDHTKLTLTNENNTVGKSILQKPDLLLRNENFKTPDEVTIISQDKQVHRKVTSKKETDSGSKQTLNNKIDLGKQIPREVTPAREIPPTLKQTSSNINKQDFNTDKIGLCPQMTSTPENDMSCPTTANITLGNSYIVRMSEIPSIPAIANNLEVDDSLDEELLYSSKPTCSAVKIGLFGSPIKIDKIDQNPPESTLKQTKLNSFVGQSVTTATVNITERIKNTEKDLMADSWDLFISPVKKKDSLKSIKELATFSRVGKANKSRKSYENRDKIRVNIADWKKTCKKETSAAEKKEEELLKSMNEHFSELESFELCVE